MNETIAGWISTGIEVLLLSLFISGLLNVLVVSQMLNASVSEEQALVSEMKEYREHNQYDFKHVYQQDIIGAIFKNRGNPRVEVKSPLGVYTWSEDGAPCQYTTSAISSLIDKSIIYDASITRGKNGEVVAYVFVPHISGCGRG